MGVHDSRIAYESICKSSYFALHSLEYMSEQSVLHYCEFNTLVEALATEFTCLSGIQTSYVSDVKVWILIELS
ncbi:unknown [Bacteroides sp. CAG:1060]|nr:unknown [Bacteroides sp. CAG:1060]